MLIDYSKNHKLYYFKQMYIDNRIPTVIMIIFFNIPMTSNKTVFIRITFNITGGKSKLYNMALLYFLFMKL